MKPSSGLSPGYFSVAWRAGAALVAAAVIAGCGGGHAQSVVPSGTQTDGTARQTESVPSIPATLYVSGQGSVYVYPLSAQGDDPPTAVLAGEYSAVNHTAIAGIATDRKGTLSILTNYGGSEGPHAPSCHVLRYPFGAPTGSTPTLAYQCAPDAFAGLGIISGANGEIDVWDETSPESIATQLERFLPSNPTPYSATAPLRAPKVPPGVSFAGIAAGAAGNFFLAYNTPGGPEVLKFLGTSTNPLNPVKVGVAPSGFVGTAVAAGRGTVWFSVFDPSSGSSTIASAPAGTMNFGPAIFVPPGVNITALACDASGNVYAGFSTAAGTGIAEFSPAGSPLGFINNPVRRGNPAGAVVTGIAIAQ